MTVIIGAKRVPCDSAEWDGVKLTIFQMGSPVMEIVNVSYSDISVEDGTITDKKSLERRLAEAEAAAARYKAAYEQRTGEVLL